MSRSRAKKLRCCCPCRTNYDHACAGFRDQGTYKAREQKRGSRATGLRSIMLNTTLQTFLYGLRTSMSTAIALVRSVSRSSRPKQSDDQVVVMHVNACALRGIRDFTSSLVGFVPHLTHSLVRMLRRAPSAPAAARSPTAPSPRVPCRRFASSAPRTSQMIFS